MSPCKLNDVKITSLESDEYDPIITVGSGNTASASTNTYCVDTTNYSDIKIDTSALNNEEITITGGDSAYDLSGLDYDLSQYTTSCQSYEEPIVSAVNFDHITFDDVPTPGIETDNPRKYKEDESIKALQDYISTTYGGHYTSDNNNVQTLDLIESVGDAESFCRSNAIKYLSRYDKKGQAKRDILKALHYSLLLYHFSGQLNETTTRGYETF